MPSMLEAKKVDTKEFELPETIFIRDIDNRVFQGIIIKCLSKISDISLLEGNFLDNILGRPEGVKGIYAEQDLKQHSINLRVEVNVQYGVSIPEKAEEIQTKVTEEVTKMTGLHVASVHVVFKGLVDPEHAKKAYTHIATALKPSEEYSDVF